MSDSSASILWTIGHSTRPIDEFIGLLNAHAIQLLVDVRTVPRSRYNPQFNTDTLAQSLYDAGIACRHSPELGGLRKPIKDSINLGWRNDSFRGYADYMQTKEFGTALDKLIADSRKRHTVIMCAEAVPWRCHRSLIADALTSRGQEVRHIMTATKADRHQLTSFAKLENGALHYPDTEGTPRLF
ncbi:MAG: DUF488 domain-containing protein [Nitrospira defluvii]|nr:DUF488 domain-containing protein [Nitrospira defluvii]